MKKTTVVLTIAVIAAVGIATMGVATAADQADQADQVNETDNANGSYDTGDNETDAVNGSYDTGQEHANVTLPEIDGAVPQDLDGDGVHEDLNGNDRVDSDDVVTLFENIDTPEVAENPTLFDFNDNARVDFDDVIQLLEAR